MNTIDLRNEVEKAVRTEWSRFKAAHPHLATALDQDLLIETITESLQDDPAFNDALLKARVGATALGAVIDFVETWVRNRLRLL